MTRPHPSSAPADDRKSPLAMDQASVDFDHLYTEHAPKVARWAALLGGPAIDADDVVQETFLMVRRLLPRFRGDAPLTTWLYRITANMVARERRRLRWRSLFGLRPAPADEPLFSGPTPLEEVERRQALRLAYRVLDSMAEKYRTAFILYELEERSGQEIAELLGLKLKTVWVHLHRARKLFDEGVARQKRILARRSPP
jgi:RNA polymerase sigma-70 factor (ECF subfamily)